MNKEFCPFCQKSQNMYLSSEKTITESPGGNIKTIIIIKEYTCQGCGYMFIRREEPNKK